MIDIEKIKEYYPPTLRGKDFSRLIVREHFQYMILDYLSTSKYAKNLCFIGGTNLRLVHKIDRFSEDLDFDIKHLKKEDFVKMTDSVAIFLQNSGFRVEIDDKEKDNKLKAFRRNIVFPEFLYENKLSPFKEEKFLIKIECQDQGFSYQPKNEMLRGCGFFFNFPVPENPVLCSMKLSALLDRQKGRDFYDAMFLLSKTEPDFNYLEKRWGISNIIQLVNALKDVVDKTDLKHKSRDFEHLIFNKENTKKILFFDKFIKSKYPQLASNKDLL